MPLFLASILPALIIMVDPFNWLNWVLALCLFLPSWFGFTLTKWLVFDDVDSESTSITGMKL